MNATNDAVRLKRQILIKIAKACLAGDLESAVDRIPFEMRPKGFENPSRCCIYRDRAIIKLRILSALGFGAEDELDEALPPSHYAKLALERERPERRPLTVLDIACSGCVRCQYLVTNACRGCIARPCSLNCPKRAISVKGGNAVIDQGKCVNCGKCMEVCPYHAIIRMPIPCEESCAFGAIGRSEDGKQFIDFDKCASCGKCMVACPFGAVAERSQAIDVIRKIKSGAKVVALAAPSIVGQFPATLERIAAGVAKLGFARMEEVALGAEETAKNETVEFEERMKRGDRLMTTSCCPAFVEAAKRHVPELLPFVSHTLSPMKYTSLAVKRSEPEAVTVFIGPCVAKRVEAFDDPNTDYVLTFEELGALFVAAGIEPANLEPLKPTREADPYARGFATSCGVSAAILNERKNAEGGASELPEIKSCFINGLDLKALRQLKLYAQGKLPGNFLEVMACQGGCVGGPAALGIAKIAAKAVEDLVKKGKTS